MRDFRDEREKREPREKRDGMGETSAIQMGHDKEAWGPLTVMPQKNYPASIPPILRTYFSIPRSSTSKTSVEPGLIIGGAPRSP